MKDILEELDRVEKLVQVEPDFHINQIFQSDMEWWILGLAVKILKEVGEGYPTFAQKILVPDFNSFYESKREFHPLEVTEVLLPDRKRVDEYRKGKELTDLNKVEGKLIDPIEKPWSTLEDCFKKKFRKKYPLHTWLIIYFNISYSYISEYGYWHKTLLANAVKWDLKASPFDRVLILNASGKAMVELFPRLLIIKPEE